MEGNGRDRRLEPTDLRYVGPATAAAIDRASFSAADIRDRSVSYADLLAAGVNPGVAAKLRREYSLIWSYEWVTGADLNRRAELVTGLDRAQREWIAASAIAADGSDPPEGPDVEGERRWRERSDWVNAAEKRMACPRCDDTLVTFRMGDRQSLQCEGCGYVGIPARFRLTAASRR